MINRFRRRWITPVLVCVAIAAGPLATHSSAQAPFSYYRVQTLIDAASFGDMTWIDLEGDGDQDLVLVASSGPGSRTPTSAVYEQLGTVVTTTAEGAARPVGDYRRVAVLGGAPDLWLADLDWADYDRDGDMDAIVVGTGESSSPFTPTVHLFQGDGSGNFMPRTVPEITPVRGIVRWADFDNDGDSDLLTMGQVASGQASTSLYRNDAGVFEAVDSNLPDLSFGDAAWADVDRDGDFDIGICGAADDGSLYVHVFLNDGPGTFREVPFDGLGLAFCSLDWGDYDEDGFPDLLVSGGRVNHLVLSGETSVYRNGGGSTMEPQPFDFSGIVGGSALWLDVDNDGALDIVANGGGDLVFGRAAARIYRNESGVFRHVSNITGTFPGRLDAGDFDGDGDLDLVTIGPDRSGAPITNVFMNGELLTNASPAAPSGLLSNVAGGRVGLSWSPATDEWTTPDGLTYNVRVGTAPGVGDVMSVPVGRTGRPIRAARGNASSGTGWSIRDLPNGTYYWSVQAVDNSYNTSAFSEEESFAITESSGTKPVADDTLPLAPHVLQLSAAYPNPMRDRTQIQYDVPRSAVVQLEIYDLLGRRVVTLVDGARAAGTHLATWDGCNASGVEMAAGIYVIRLTALSEHRAAAVAVRR